MSAEINRRIDNLIRFGTIAEVDYATARARVKSGQILTDFLQFITLRAATVGEQCVILASSGELTTACILVGLYTQNSPSNSPDVHVIEFEDGAKIEYNQSTGALVVAGIKTAAITAANQIDIDCPTVNIKGNVNIMGAITTADNGGTKGNISISGEVEVKGSVTTKGDVKAGTISLQNHTHQEQGDGKLTSKAK